MPWNCTACTFQVVEDRAELCTQCFTPREMKMSTAVSPKKKRTASQRSEDVQMSRSSPFGSKALEAPSMFSMGPSMASSTTNPFERPTKRVVTEEHRMQEASQANAIMDQDDANLSDNESFFDLLQTFADLDMPEGKEQPEQCPLCPQSFVLAEFSTHVLQCIKKLDEVERQHVQQLDAKLASELQSHSDAVHPDAFRPLEECPQGAGCARTDEGHFNLLRHPLVPCPVCSLNFEIYQVNSHLNLCLQSGGLTGPQFNRQATAEAIDSDSDCEDDAKESERKRALRAILHVDVDDDSPSKLDRQHSGLSARQMQAMSQSVLNARANNMSSADLSTMLDSFKTLGFTAKNLSRTLSVEMQARSPENAQQVPAFPATPSAPPATPVFNPFSASSSAFSSSSPSLSSNPFATQGANPFSSSAQNPPQS